MNELNDARKVTQLARSRGQKAAGLRLIALVMLE